MSFKFWMVCSLVVGVVGIVRGAESFQPGVAVTTNVIDFDELDAPVQMVEQEFDPSLLENLAAPTTAPAQIRLPPAVMEAGQWRESQCGILKSAHAVFRKSSDWDKFWILAIKPYLSHPRETPVVDFSKDMVIGVFLGEKPYPGAMVEIRSAKPVQRPGEQILEVIYKDISQMQGVFMPPFPVQPFNLKKVPAFPGRVVFREAGKSASNSN
jgi:hypothetical protein